MTSAYHGISSWSGLANHWERHVLPKMPIGLTRDCCDRSSKRCSTVICDLWYADGFYVKIAKASRFTIVDSLHYGIHLAQAGPQAGPDSLKLAIPECCCLACLKASQENIKLDRLQMATGIRWETHTYTYCICMELYGIGWFCMQLLLLSMVVYLWTWTHGFFSFGIA